MLQEKISSLFSSLQDKFTRSLFACLRYSIVFPKMNAWECTSDPVTHWIFDLSLNYISPEHPVFTMEKPVLEPPTQLYSPILYNLPNIIGYYSPSLN